MPRYYSIYEAKAKLSELIRFVKRNGQVTITEYGTPVVRVIPVEEEEETLEKRIESLTSQGEIIPAQGNPAKIKPIAKRSGALRRFIESRD